MGFVIRSDDPEIFNEQEKLYRIHLEKFDKSNLNHLWRYFYYDFFHDGEIKEIKFKNGACNVSFLISSPNIERRRGMRSEHIVIDFRCTFLDVVYFNFENRNRNNNLKDTFTYLSSEINTIDEYVNIKKEKNHEGFNTLIIEVLNGKESSFIKIAFQDIFVEAVENTAYELMLTSDAFNIPIFKED